MCFRFQQLFQVVVVLSFIFPGMAWSEVDPVQCDKDIPYTVPSFKCDQGVQVNDVLIPPGNSTCRHPEELNQRCVEHAYVGSLADDNPDIDIVFSCRPEVANLIDPARIYRDIAVIQHNRKNGMTCFYQYMGGSSIQKDTIIPAANSAAGKSFYSQPVYYCSRCHTNGPFVRTPHYNQSGKIPNINTIKKYVLSKGNDSKFEVFNISKQGNACLGCHNIGAYAETHGGAKFIGKTDEVASGDWKSLLHNYRPSPTRTNYDDYMANKVGGRDKAIEAINELKGCLEVPIPPGCVIENTKRAAACTPITANQCYWMENTTGNYCWVKSPVPASNIADCKQWDSCDGGAGQSGGGCYKWAECSNCERAPW